MRSGDGDRTGEEADGSSSGSHDLVSIVHRRPKLILSVIAIVVTATICGSLALPDLYEGTALVQLEPRGKAIVGTDAVVQELKGDVPTIESEVKMVASEAILGRAIDLLRLRRDPEFSKPSALQRLQTWVGLRRAPTGVDTSAAAARGRIAPRRDAVVLALASRLQVFRVRNTPLINVTVRSTDPVKAAKIANAIAEVYVQTLLEAKERGTAHASQLIEARVAKLRWQLAAAGMRLERFKPSNDVSDGEGRLPPDLRLAREMKAVVLARDATAAARAKYEQARRLMLEGDAPASIADLLQNPTVRVLRDGLAKALRHRAELQTRYGPLHPEMEKSAADVAEAQSALTSEINKIIRGLHAAYRVAEERQKHLEADLGTPKRTVSGGKAAETTEREPQREVDAASHEVQLAQMKQTAETTGQQFRDARIVQRAGIAAFPSTPSRMNIALLGVLGAFAMAFGLAFVLEFARSGFARVADAEQSFDLPQIAAFPSFEASQDADGEMRIVRLTIADPDSTFAESTRALREAIDARREAGAARVVMLTSAMPGEGTTLIASNLAHDLAMAGSKTLLVDGDLRRARLSAALGLSGRNGLLDVLAGRATPLSAILTEQTSGVHVLPAMSSENPDASAAELLSSRAFAAALDVYKQHFDTIVIDAPPILPVVDARLLAVQADQIALVMTWRKTPRELGKRALKLLGTNRHKIAGVVVNRVDPLEFETQSCFDASENHRLTRTTENAA